MVGGMCVTEPVIHSTVAQPIRTAARRSAADQRPLFSSSRRKYSRSGARAVRSGGKSRSASHHAAITVRMLQGRNAISHCPQSTSTPPNRCISPAEVMDAVPASIILSNRSAV